MVFDIEMIKKVYSSMKDKVDHAKKICDHHQLQEYLSQPGIIPEIAKNLSSIEIRYDA